MVDPHLGACFFDHFERFFPNRLVDRKEYPLPELDRYLQVLVYERCFEACRVFATLGVSHAPLKPRSELVLIADEEWDAIPGVLACCAKSIVAGAIGGWGYVVRDIANSDPALAERIGKQHLYVTIPHAIPRKDFFQVPCGEMEARAFQALFVTDSEAQYVSRFGADAFEQCLADEGVDLYQLRRPQMMLATPE